MELKDLSHNQSSLTLLFFKTQSIAALQHEFIEVGIDITKLIEVMEITINEASQFVSTLVDQKVLPSA